MPEAWKTQNIDFTSRGLDLIHTKEDVPPDAYPILTNLQTVQEGSLQPRAGLGKFNVSALSGNNGINSLAQYEDPAADYKAVIAGCGSNIYADSVPITFAGKTFGNGPKTFAFYRPGNYVGTVGYCADIGAMGKFYQTQGTYTGWNMGTAPNLHTMSAPYIPASSATTIDAVNDASTWTGSVVILTTEADFINVSKPTQTAAPGSVNTLQLSIAGPSLIGNASKAVTLDLQRSFTNESRVEFFAKPDDPANIKEIRVIIGLGPSVTGATNATPIVITTSAAHGYATGDTIAIASVAGNTAANGVWTITRLSATTFSLNTSVGNGAYTSGGSTASFKDNYYIRSIRGADLSQAVSGGPETIIPARRQGTEARNATIGDRVERRTLTGRDNQFINPSDQSRLVDPVPDDYGSDQVILGTHQWQAFSFRRDQFLRVGSNESLDWSNVGGIRFEVLTSTAASSPTLTRFYQIDIVATSALDSGEGIPYDYRHTYWNATISNESNPSQEQPEGINIVRRSARLSILPSADAQVTHVRVYRRGGLLGDYHRLITLSVASDMTTYTVTGADNPAAPNYITLTIGAGHSLLTGDWVLVQDVGGQTGANGVFQIANVTGTQAQLAGSHGAGAYTSGGTVKTFFYTDVIADEDIAINPILRVDRDQPVTTLQTRTNLLTYSEQFDNAAWTKTTATVYANDANGPFGSQSADLVTATAPGAVVNQTIAGVSGTYTFSIYAKRKTGTGSISIALFDSGVGGIATLMGVSNFPDEHWQRFEYTTTFASLVGSLGVSVFMGASGDEIWLWGAQLETGSAPTAYIRTVASSQSLTDATRLAQPCHTVFGPFLGKWLFALGDQYRPSYLYWCNAQTPDEWSPANTLEASAANEPLQAGLIFEGRAFLFTKNRMLVIYPALTGAATFTVLDTPCNVGLWNRRAFCVGPAIWFVGRNGIYETTGGEPINITEQSFVRPIFNGQSVNGYGPVKFNTNNLAEMSLTWYDPYLYFLYMDTSDNYRQFRYHTGLKRWEPWQLPATMQLQCGLWCGSNLDRPNDLVFGAKDGWTYKLTGTADVHGDTTSNAITCTLLTGDFNQAMPRALKYYGDLLVEADCNGTTISITPILNNGSVTGTTQTITGTGRQRYFVPLQTGTLPTDEPNTTISGRSIALQFTWTSATATPVLYNVNLSYLPQELERTFLTGDYDDLGAPFKKYIWGAVVDCDTQANAITLSVWADGQVATTQVLPAGEGRRKVELSWPDFQAHSVRVQATSALPHMIYGIDWYYTREQAQITHWNSYWQPAPDGADVYVNGCELEANTFGVAKSVIFERDDNVAIVTQSVTTVGHDKVRVTWPVARAHILRLRSVDAVEGILYKVTWLQTAEPPLLAGWESNWEAPVAGGDSYCWGLELECDTQGQAKPITVYSDGATIVTDHSISANGRSKVRITWPTIKAKTLRFTSDYVDGRLYAHTWLQGAAEAPALGHWDSNWEPPADGSDVYVTGLEVEYENLSGTDKYLSVVRDGGTTVLEPLWTTRFTATFAPTGGASYVDQLSGWTRTFNGVTYGRSPLAIASGQTVATLATTSDPFPTGYPENFNTAATTYDFQAVDTEFYITALSSATAVNHFLVAQGLVPVGAGDLTRFGAGLYGLDGTTTIKGLFQLTGKNINDANALVTRLITFDLDETIALNTHYAVRFEVIPKGANTVCNANLYRVLEGRSRKLIGRYTEEISNNAFAGNGSFVGSTGTLLPMSTGAVLGAGLVFDPTCSFNVSKFTIDSGTVTSALGKLVTTSGRTKARLNWSAVRAKTMRFFSNDGVLARLYKWAWLWQKEPPEQQTWDSNYQDDGSLEDKWISGLYLECDTAAANHDIQVAIDGADYGAVHTVNAATRRTIKVSLGPTRGVTMRWYSSGPNAAAMRVYGWRWIWEAEPTELTNWATNWEPLDTPYEAYLKGISIEADTFGVDKLIALHINGDDTAHVATFKVNCNGRDKVFIPLQNVLARTARLAPIDSVTGRLYKYHFILDDEPAKLTRLQTQERAYEQNAWMHMREAFVCLRSWAPVTLTVTIDGTPHTYTIASTNGARSKVRVVFDPVKGKMYKFELVSSQAMKVYNEDCSVYVRPWNSELGYKVYQIGWEGGE